MVIQYIITCFHHIKKRFSALTFREIISYSFFKNIMRRSKAVLFGTAVPNKRMSVAYTRVKRKSTVTEFTLNSFYKFAGFFSCYLVRTVVGNYFIFVIGLILSNINNITSENHVCGFNIYSHAYRLKR